MVQRFGFRPVFRQQVRKDPMPPNWLLTFFLKSCNRAFIQRRILLTYITCCSSVARNFPWMTGIVIIMTNFAIIHSIYYTILYYTMLYYTILYYTMLYYTSILSFTVCVSLILFPFKISFKCFQFEHFHWSVCILNLTFFFNCIVYIFQMSFFILRFFMTWLFDLICVGK